MTARPQVPIEAMKDFDVEIIRDCGCTIWRFRFDPQFGLDPWDDDRLEWWSAATSDGTHRSRTTQPTVSSKGIKGIPGSRGPQGRKSDPMVDVIAGELVLVGKELCKHMGSEQEAFGGRELHRWSSISRLMKLAVRAGFDPSRPMRVELVNAMG